MERLHYLFKPHDICYPSLPCIILGFIQSDQALSYILCLKHWLSFICCDTLLLWFTIVIYWFRQSLQKRYCDTASCGWYFYIVYVEIPPQLASYDISPDRHYFPYNHYFWGLLYFSHSYIPVSLFYRIVYISVIMSGYYIHSCIFLVIGNVTSSTRSYSCSIILC